MKISDVTVMRMAVMQRLQIVYGIKLRSSLKIHDDSSTRTPCHLETPTKVFGVPLENVHACALTEYGLVPRFLVDACQHLLMYADTEGLFRKSSSVTRLKSLKAKVEQGEKCLTTALPCDVASLVKQFFRELPAPIFPVELHQALLQAQQLPTVPARTSATQLLSCLLPERNVATLRFLSCFLNRLSQRATENKMTAYNLSLIFAPNLFPFGTDSKCIEGHDKLEVAVLYTFIENTHHIGVIPDDVVEMIPSLLDTSMLEEMDMDRRWKRRGRLSDAGSVQRTPSCSRQRYSLSSKDGYRSTSEKTPRHRRSFCLGMLPRILFKPGKADSCPLVTENQTPSCSTKRNRRVSFYQKVRRAVEENISCLSSSKQEPVHPVPIPTHLPPSALNLATDTPVGKTSRKIQKSDPSPKKRSSLSNILKTLCCLSDPSQSEVPDQCSSSSACGQSQDGGRVLIDSQNNNSSSQVLSSKVRDEAQADTAPCVTPAGPVFALRTPCSPVDARASLFKTPATPPLRPGMNQFKTPATPPLRSGLNQFKTPATSPLRPGMIQQGREQNMTEAKYEETCEETTRLLDSVALEQNHDASEEDEEQLETLCGANLNNTTCNTSVPSLDQERVCLLKQSACTAQPVLGTPTAPKPHTGKVAAHIKIFSSLHLKCLTPKAIRSPINFQRTPVYKYVKRINSLIERGCMERGSFRGRHGSIGE